MKNRIEFDDGTILTDDDFIGGIKYQQDLCGNGDIEIGTVIQQQINFDVLYDELTALSLVGKRGLWKVKWINEGIWTDIGYFTITDAKRKNKVSSTITAFDDMLRFEVFIDELLENETITLPTTLENHFTQILELAQIKYDGQQVVTTKNLHWGNNANFEVKDNYRAINITAKQVLSYIAQITGSYIWLDSEGKLNMTKYGSRTIDNGINNDFYKSYSKALYEVQPINWLVVNANENDYGVQASEANRAKDNQYYITNNPLLYAESTAEIQDTVTNIYNAINNIVYTPMEVKLFKDYGINCGDYVIIDGIKSLVTSKKIDASGITLTSSGNKWREATGDNLNPSIIALRGKTNELYRDIEETRSTLTDKYDKLETQFRQTAESITMEVNADGSTASITIGGETFTAINEEGLEEKVGTIVMEGYVTFEGLEDGTTSIDGSCIKTGTIEADRINMNGAISWSDLDTDLQTTINEKSDSDTELPDYIKDTYIDGATIKSPTIEGNTINMYGGVFNIKDSTGQSTYGYIGKGSGYAGNDQHTEGIIMGASAGSSGLGDGNYYFIATDSGVRMQGGSNAIYVTDSGIFKKINGTSTALGTAVFG